MGGFDLMGLMDHDDWRVGVAVAKELAASYAEKDEAPTEAPAYPRPAGVVFVLVAHGDGGSAVVSRTEWTASVELGLTRSASSTPMPSASCSLVANLSPDHSVVLTPPDSGFVMTHEIAYLRG